MKTTDARRDTASKARLTQGEAFGGCASTSLPWRSSMRDLLYAAAALHASANKPPIGRFVACVPAYQLTCVRGGIMPPRRRWPGTDRALAHLASEKNVFETNKYALPRPWSSEARPR